MDASLSTEKSQIKRWSRGRKILLAAICSLIVAGIVIEIVIQRSEPIIRGRVIETLSTRFKSKVELDSFHVSVFQGLQVEGEGLRIYGAEDPNAQAPGVQPLIGVAKFNFRTSVRSLFRTPMHVNAVHVEGLEINIPPKEQRTAGNSLRSKAGKAKIYVDEILADNTKLIINTLKPGKFPLEFDISMLKLKDVGPGSPMHFDAILVNPKPIGDINSSGYFGPFHEDNPRESPVKGDYDFNNANLGTLKGIAGILSSKGSYHGTLGSIEVEGDTDTPDFRLNISGHPIELHTHFQATVDGTSGDTYLHPVDAKLGNSEFSARGAIVREAKGRHIQIVTTAEKARIQDFLRLAVKTDPPLMSGGIRLKADLDLPPGEGDLIDRLKLKSSFAVSHGSFSNDTTQERINALSLRSTGKPKLVKEASEHDVQSNLKGTFSLNQRVLTFPNLEFQIPGTKVTLAGQYSLDGNVFDFRGKARLDAKLSHMVTGWKAILLKPVDPFFAKGGSGTVVPVKITGTKTEPHFGLNFGSDSGK